MKKVINLKGTTDEKCQCCESWINHWENFVNEPAVFCSASSCNETNDIEGAHVEEINSGTIGIIPLCKTHNKHDGVFEVLDSTKIAPLVKLYGR